MNRINQKNSEWICTLWRCSERPSVSVFSPTRHTGEFCRALNFLILDFWVIPVKTAEVVAAISQSRVV